jgi:hypothetical protein
MSRGRLILTLVLAAYGLYYLLVPGHYGLFDYVDLLEHDHFIGQLVRFAGVLIFAYATMRGLTYARQEASPTSPPPAQP